MTENSCSSKASPNNQAICDEIKGMRRYALYLTRSPEAAEELLQDTLVRALTKIHLFQPGTNFRAWLATVMLNVFRQQLARARSRPLVADEHVESYSIPVAAGQEKSLQLKIFLDELEKLPKEQRQILQTVVMDGASYMETAERLNLPIGTVRSRLFRARATLKKRCAV